MKRYIVWSKRELDLDDPWEQRWFICQVLLHGRAEAIAALDWGEVRRLLPELDLPPEIRRLWERYFEHQEARAGKSAHVDPAVHIDRLAGDVAGLLRGEDGDHRCNLLRLGRPSQWDLLGDLHTMLL